MAKAYLDIDIGDVSAWQQASDKFARAEAWMKAVGTQVRLLKKLHCWNKPGSHLPLVCNAMRAVHDTLVPSSWLQYGLSGDVEALDEDSKQLLLESYAADPTWAAKGEASVTKPDPVRAGRIVVQLLEAEVSGDFEWGMCFSAALVGP